MGCGPTGQLAWHASRTGQTAAVGYLASNGARSVEIHGGCARHRRVTVVVTVASRPGGHAFRLSRLKKLAVVLFCSAVWELASWVIDSPKTF